MIASNMPPMSLTTVVDPEEILPTQTMVEAVVLHLRYVKDVYASLNIGLPIEGR